MRADAQDRAVFCAGAPDTPPSIVRLDLGTGALHLLKQATDVGNDPELKGYFTAVKPISFPTKGRKKAYGLFYPPANPDFVAPKNELPPLVVKCQGAVRPQQHPRYSICAFNTGRCPRRRGLPRAQHFLSGTPSKIFCVPISTRIDPARFFYKRFQLRRRHLAMSDVPQCSRPFADCLTIGVVVTSAAKDGCE